LRQGRRGSLGEFFAELGRAFVPVDPNPNILAAAGALRDVEAVNPSDPKARNSRCVGTADAIHLTTCLYIRDVMGDHDIVFHTLDEGKGKSWEGKCVPLLGFEKWYPPELRNGVVGDVCSLPRTKPQHPQLKFELARFDANAIFSGKRP
jgi:hypothetical protein